MEKGGDTKLTDPQIIELRGPWIMNWSLPTLSQLPQVIQLSLIDTLVTDSGIERLNTAINLQEFAARSFLISDRSMKTLCQLPLLRGLMLWNAPRITDKGIASIRQCHGLTELYLQGTQLTYISVDAFAQLPELWSINLENTRITDLAVERLATLPRLSILNLRNNNIAGKTLHTLQGKYGIRLNLSKCPVNDGSITSAAEHLNGVRELNLSDTGVTDKCLGPISKIETLETIYLSGTAVTDVGIAHFLGHQNLSTLYIRKTNIKENTIANLKDSCPKMQVVYT